MIASLEKKRAKKKEEKVRRKVLKFCYGNVCGGVVCEMGQVKRSSLQNMGRALTEQMWDQEILKKVLA